jgi:hypothetical protein
LYQSAKCNRVDLKPQSTITIRIRMEIEDERTLLLSNLQYPSSVFVNGVYLDKLQCVCLHYLSI